MHSIVDAHPCDPKLLKKIKSPKTKLQNWEELLLSWVEVDESYPLKTLDWTQANLEVIENRYFRTVFIRFDGDSQYWGLNAVTTMKEFTILQGNKKDVIQRNRGIFEVNLPPFRCVPDFFLGVVSIYFLLLTALGLLSFPQDIRCKKTERIRCPGARQLFLEGWVSPETLEFGHLWWRFFVSKTRN